METGVWELDYTHSPDPSGTGCFVKPEEIIQFPHLPATIFTAYLKSFPFPT